MSEMDRYVSSVISTIVDGDKEESLSSVESKLGKKLLDVRSRAEQLQANIRVTVESIVRAQKKVDALRNEHLELISRAAAFTEALIVLKFGDQLEEKSTLKGNGSRDPSDLDPEKTQAPLGE